MAITEPCPLRERQSGNGPEKESTIEVLDPNLEAQTRDRHGLLYLVYFIYFFCGLTQCFEGVFLPEFKEYFHLTYQQQMYIVFAKNLPFLGSFAVAFLVQRVGYKSALALAMLFYAAGTLLLVPGLRVDNYVIILCGFLIIGIGFTIQMVAANPLMSALGSADTASSRLNFGNALGAVAQIIAPASLTLIIPAVLIGVRAKAVYMETLFLSLGVILIAVACSTVLFHDVPVPGIQRGDPPVGSTVVERSVWRHRRVVLGFVVIFLALGAEAGAFSFFRNYLEDPQIGGLSARTSQRLFTVYFALFALGRLLASWIQKYIKPKVHLQLHLGGALICLTVVILAKGSTAVAAFLILGFLVSIFFPTLYAIAMEGIGAVAPQASGLLTLGFLGCAVIPVAQGALADSIGLQRSFVIGIAVYLVMGAYLYSGPLGNGRENPGIDRVAPSVL